jgi:flagellar basal-body rod protein FlgB
MTGIINSSSLDAAKTALDGLSLRQQVISRNIANVDTPGYQSQNVSFEQAVKTALKKSDTAALSITNANHIQLETPSSAFSVADRVGGTERADQNDVDIDTEMAQMNETALRYQALTQMISKKFSLIKSIVVSR